MTTTATTVCNIADQFRNFLDSNPSWNEQGLLWAVGAEMQGGVADATRMLAASIAFAAKLNGEDPWDLLMDVRNNLDLLREATALIQVEELEGGSL